MMTVPELIKTAKKAGVMFKNELAILDPVIPPPKVTIFPAGIHNFYPDSRTKNTKVEIQAAGGSGGMTGWSTVSNFCSAMSGANGGNFFSFLITSKLSTSAIRVVVGQLTLAYPGNASNGRTGVSSEFGTMIIAGGVGARTTTGTWTSLIYRALAQSGNTLNSPSFSYKVLKEVKGGRGGVPYVPYHDQKGFIKGGDGGTSQWSTMSRSNAAIYSGYRTTFTSINEDGSGYGYGGCGISCGGSQGHAGNSGGEGLTIITEYLG